MKKIPTLFVRDEATNRKYVRDEVTPGCEWVLAGEGTATRKFDGTSCMVRNGYLYKRHEVKPDKPEPRGFEFVEHDDVTDKTVGWVPVGDGPEDKWHREAMVFYRIVPDGTYELCGPKVQGNPQEFTRHVLVEHGVERITELPRDFDGLRAWLADSDFEGVVWHHPDGRMAKLKKRDFPA